MIGRIFGWVLVVLACIMASGDAVMALGDVSSDGLSTGEVLTLLVGTVPDPLATPPALEAFYTLPAWGLFGLCGLALLLLFRKRSFRRGHRHTRAPIGLQSTY